MVIETVMNDMKFHRLLETPMDLFWAWSSWHNYGFVTFPLNSILRQNCFWSSWVGKTWAQIIMLHFLKVKPKKKICTYKSNFPETNGSVADWWQIWRKMWAVVPSAFPTAISSSSTSYCYMRPDICHFLKPTPDEARKSA